MSNDFGSSQTTSIWHRLCRWLVRLGQRSRSGSQQQPQPAPMPQDTAIEPLTRRHDLNAPMVVPAEGCVFDFQVYASLFWTSDGGLHPGDFTRWAHHHAQGARRRLRHIVADLARNYPPHQAHDLETEINRTMAARPIWRFGCDGTDLTCRPQVRVQLDDQVRHIVRPFWERRITMECEHEIALRRAELAEQLSQRWLAVLEELAQRPLAGEAAALTEAELAAVVEKITTAHHEHDQRWYNLMERLMGNSDDLPPFERAETFDLLLDRLRHDHGRGPAVTAPGTVSDARCGDRPAHCRL